jgi:alpha-1,3-glucosyltransferase
MSTRHATSSVHQRPISLTLFVLLLAALLRILIGFQPHSGQDNYHGSKTAYGGDFEAQRHWMELTVHVPIGDWYWYDLDYWGLDYPPLTAYVSYVCGMGSSWLVGPETIQLGSSRGIEDKTHKAYMRATVVVLDMMIFGSAVYYSILRRDRRNARSLWTVLLALSQPAILLIDHGHFQYNTIALGLSLWSFHYMTQLQFSGCLAGAVLFCLALNFKQIALYYAPAVFCYLLGRCLAEPRKFVLRFGALAMTVIATFALLWQPFLAHGPSHKETTALERGLHVLHRIFPFERGLFEGKVSNLWCALSTKPISIRERIDGDLQPIVSLAATLVLILPACYMLFRVGMGQAQRFKDRDWVQLLWGVASTALAFFLASFQVHEKSILFALAPISLLVWHDSIFVEWFSLVSTWTLWPLVQIDRLEVAYICSITMFTILGHFRRLTTRARGPAAPSLSTVFSSYYSWIPTLSYWCMMCLHVAQMVVPAPGHLPDLFPVLWSIAGCCMLCVAWMCTSWKQLELFRLVAKIKVH